MDIAATNASPELYTYIGLADACELMAATFDFPTLELAQALTDGSYEADCIGCFTDIGLDQETLDSISCELKPFRNRDPRELLDTLKKGNSILYLAPGLNVPVWPYESPFFTTRLDPDAKPSLFRTQIALDIESLMKDAGIMFEHARTEPIDSIWDEFRYLSFLYGSLARAYMEKDEVKISEWHHHIDIFTQKHVSNWFFDFMGSSVEKAPHHSYGQEYASFARIGTILTKELLAHSSAAA